MRILFVGRVFGSKLDGGGYVTKRNLELLKKIANVDEFLVDLKSTPKSKIINALCLKSYSYLDYINAFRNRIKNNFYDVIFFDGSFFGSFSHEVKKTSPNSKVYTFLHNVESIYYKKRSNGLISLMWSKYISHIERKSLIFSDYTFSLNQRDADLIDELYGLRVNDILPISFPSISDYVRVRPNVRSKGRLKLLFVGSAFYANIEGINWFIKNVMPFVNAELIVVGKDMNSVISSSENIKVMGYVEDLSNLYYEANAVVAPIFSGSGMKTKTAEALREGKMLLASEEALVGYNIQNVESVIECNTADEYIKKINYLAENGVYSWYQSALELFDINYSDEVVLNVLHKNIL